MKNIHGWLCPYALPNLFLSCYVLFILVVFSVFANEVNNIQRLLVC